MQQAYDIHKGLFLLLRMKSQQQEYFFFNLKKNLCKIQFLNYQIDLWFY